MQARDLIASALVHVETGQVDKAVFSCLRLARKMGDSFNAVIFLRELSPDDKQFSDAFFAETDKLNPEAQQLLWKVTAERWLSTRTICRPSDSQDKSDRVLTTGIAEIAAEIEQLENTITDLQLPPGMGAYDIAALTDQYSAMKSQARLKISIYNAVRERIRTRCLEYATRMERLLDSAAGTANYLGRLQVEVNSYYADRCPTAYEKLLKASSLLESSNPEDHALLLTSTRRAIKAVADFHFPARNEPHRCVDGTTRTLGDDQYLNRLEEFCLSLNAAGASKRLLTAEVRYLIAFLRRLNDIASKGVHSEIKPSEAKQGLLGLYIFLGNLIEWADSKHDARAPEPKT